MVIDATSFFDTSPPPLPSLTTTTTTNTNNNDVNGSGYHASTFSRVDLITRSKAICTAVTTNHKQLETSQSSSLGMMSIMIEIVIMLNMLMYIIIIIPFLSIRYRG